jgi:hypothetical protein
LLELVDRFELEVEDRRVKDDIAEPVGRSHRVSLADVLLGIPVTDWRALCERGSRP